MSTSNSSLSIAQQMAADGSLPDPAPGSQPGAPAPQASIAQQLVQSGMLPDMPQPQIPMRAVVSAASTLNPDTEAKTQQLAQRAGMGVDLTRHNPQAAQQRALNLEMEQRQIEFTNPVLARELSNPNFAAVAHDDLDSLSGIENGAATMRALTPMQGFESFYLHPAFQKLMQFPLTRMGIDAVAGVSGLAGNVGSFFGWRGNGPTKQNLAQRIESDLSPANADLYLGGKPDTGNDLDALVKNVAPMAPLIVASGGASMLADALGISGNAAKLLSALGLSEESATAATGIASKVLPAVGTGGLFSASQGGETYTQMSAAGKSNAASRRAANLSAGLSLVPNIAAGLTDFVPGLNRFPLLSAVGAGGVLGATGQAAQNVATGQSWSQGIAKAAVQGAAMQGGMHLGFGMAEPFRSAIAATTDYVENSKLRARSPEAFQSNLAAQFEGDASLRIPAQDFVNYFQSKGLDPAVMANEAGVSNLDEAALAGSDLEIPAENFFGKLDPEHQRGLLDDVVDPATDMTARQTRAAKQELQDLVTGDGGERLKQLVSEFAEADKETQATPEWQKVYSDLKQRYVNAGENDTTADGLAKLQANAISYFAKNSGLKPDELLALHNPNIVAGEAPAREGVRYQDAIDKIRSVVGAASEVGGRKAWTKYAPASEWLRGVAKSAGLDIDGFEHGIDADAIRHARSEHGDADAEARRGQVAITDQDFEKLPEVVNEPDRVVFGNKTRSNGLDAIGYVKRLEDGTIAHVEEVRTGRKRLSAVSMMKYPAALDVDTVANNLRHNVQDDGGRTFQIIRRETDDPASPAKSEASGEPLYQSGTEDEPESSGLNKRAQRNIDLAKLQGEMLKGGPEPQPDPAAKARSGKRGWFRALGDGRYEIGKTPIGDKSTFIHEPGHYYLEMFREMTQRAEASQRIKDDFAKLTEWLGTTPEEVHKNGFTREQHEKWAEATEAYIESGKAPTPGLRKVFHQFGVWLTSIYNRATRMGVEITPEIRGVMDRLYAGEEATRRAEQESSRPLFEKPEDAEWTEAEYRNYAEARGIAVDKAREQVQAELNEAAERERTQEFREEHGNVREAVTQELDARPDYTAIRSLRRGSLDDETPITLSREALVQQFGEERVKALNQLHRGLYRNEGGTDAETAAEIFGYGSGAQMMRALESAPRRAQAIEAATRDYLVNKYGDVRYDGTLVDRARFNLENQERAGNIYRELRTLKARLARVEQKAADSKAAMAAITMEPLERYQEAARAMIRDKAPADLQPNRYLNASRKYSRDAFDALRKGNVRAAAEAKNKELLNHFLFREASAERDWLDKFEKYSKVVQKQTTQQKLGLAGSDFRDQFNWLLARYKLSAPMSAPERPLTDWASDMYDQGNEPAIATSILNGERFADYRSVPMSELHDLHDALTNIRHLAMREFKMYVQGKQIEFADARAAMVKAARENLKEKPVTVLKKEPGYMDLVRRLQGVAVGSTRMEFLINKLDGGTRGPWHDYLWNLYENSKGDEFALQHEFTKAVNDHVESEGARQGMRLYDKVGVDGIPSTEPVTRKDLVSFALNMGNEGNLDRLRKSFAFHGWDPAAVERIGGMLTREEWGFVQNIWESLKPYGKRMIEFEKRLTGLPPVMVEVKPFKVSLDDGTEMDLAGGYYPIKIDPDYSLKGYEEDAGKTARNLMEAGYGRATTSRGYTKERNGFGGPLLFDYQRVLGEHIAKVTKDLSHREFMLAANKILTDPEIRQTLRETLSPVYEKEFMPWLRSTVNDRNGSLGAGDSDIRPLLEKVRSNLIKASLGFKASTSLLQFTHLPRILLFTRPASFMQAMVDFAARPIETTQMIREMSPNEMRFRGENLDRDYHTALEEVSKKKGVPAAVTRFSLAALRYADHVVSFNLWLSVYRDALQKNPEMPDTEAHALAVHDADAAVRMGIGTGTTGDLPPVMRRSDWGSRMETMLYGFHNLNFNILRHKVGYETGAAFRAGDPVQGVATMTAGMTMAWLIPALLGSAITGQGPKDGENIGDWAAKRALFFAAGTLPLLKDLGSMVEFGDMNPMVSLAKRAVTTFEQTGSHKEGKDWTALGINWLQLGGDFTGVPGTNQGAQTLRYLHRAQQGKIDNPNAWNALVGGGYK